MFNVESLPDIHWHFDFDGTLFFTHEALLNAYGESIRKYGGILTTAANEALIRGESYKTFLKLCSWDKAEPDFEVVRTHKNEIYLSNMELIEPNFSLIYAALSLNSNTSIVTSSSREVVQAILKHFNLNEYFHNIVASDDVINIKPNPEPYLKSISKYPNAIHIAVEDSELGVISASRAGLLVLKVSEFSIA